MTNHVLVPSSLAREVSDKREATRKLGYVARAAAVFRVDRLVVFDDAAGATRWDDGFVETVLRYATTPPYLRKEAFGARDELEYAGVLPPLRVPSWAGSESDDSGSLREGLVTQVGPEERVRVNCGLQHPISLRLPDGMSVTEGERVTVRVSSRRPVRAKLVDAPTPGPHVVRSDLAAALDTERYCIAASRHGTPLTVDRLADVSARIDRDGAVVAFGAPKRGLPEMRDGRPADPADPAGRFDVWLNTIPNQGSEVVRTEEALFATLACLNIR